MDDKIIFKYLSDEKEQPELSLQINGDIELKTLMGHFVKFTCFLGYHPDSWKRVIKDICYDEFGNTLLSEDYTIVDWADNVIYGY